MNLSTWLPARRINRSALTATATRALPYLLVILAFALRIHRITYQSIWWDEAYSVHLAQQSIVEAVRLTANDIHPPLYYVLLHFWGWLAGFSELSVRFLSLILSMLLIPLIYRITLDILDRRAALATTAIAAIAPPYVVYSQEARMYTLVPLQYLLIIYALHLLTRPATGSSWSGWVLLIAIEVLSLYTHYFAFSIVVYLNLFLGASLLRHRQALGPRRWLASQATVALLYLPWAWIALRQTIGYVSDLYQPPSLASFTNTIWRFYNWGTYEAVGAEPLRSALTWVTALTLTVALALFLREGKWRRQVTALVGHTVGPLAILFLVLRFRPFAHPRYAMACSVPLYMMLGCAIGSPSASQGWRKMSRALLALAVLSTSTFGLEAIYFDCLKDDVRGMIRYLEPLSGPEDLIIVDPKDYSIAYYYMGEAPVAMVDTSDEGLGTASLRELVRGKNRVFLAHSDRTVADKRNLPAFLLELSGRLVGEQRFRGYDLRIYEPEQAVFYPEIKPISADFSQVHLTGAFYQREVEADNAICLALRWRLDRTTKTAYKAVVILWDEAGRRLSGADVLLQDTRGLSSECWPPGEEAVNYFVVPVPIGTPPLPYRTTVSVYDAATMERLPFLDAAGDPAGEDFPLGQVVLTRAHSFEHDPYGTRRYLSLETLEEPEIADGLALEGFAISKEMVRPQEVVSIVVQWLALRGGLPQYAPRLRLRQGDTIWAEVGSTIVEERYPTTEWAAGEVVLEQRDLVYPPRVGQAVLEVVVADNAVALGEMELDSSELAFEAQAMQHRLGVRFGGFAELLGYDFDKTEVTTDEKVRLTLYWRAINQEPLTTDYTVFTHLLSQDGRLIGQHDGIPVGGERPTTSWVPGEVIADGHEMEFSDLGHRGKALIEVGLYESFAIERILTEEGGDHLILPSEIKVK